MSILEKLLEDIKIDDNDIKLKKMCDDIMKEEAGNFSVDKKYIPSGPTIFLSLECPKDQFGNIIFICLEKEINDYVVSKWSLKKEKLFKQTSSVVPFSSSNLEKILVFYVKILKIFREGIKYE